MSDSLRRELMIFGIEVIIVGASSNYGEHTGPYAKVHTSALCWHSLGSQYTV